MRWRYAEAHGFYSPALRGGTSVGELTYLVTFLWRCAPGLEDPAHPPARVLALRAKPEDPTVRRVVALRAKPEDPSGRRVFALRAQP
ncbi:hypothetical protein GCM10011488_29280 [Steroidobacter agaridevorans]|nr:hypothetical protein GCM10011488_29280 [Steroidobacter agaridevorans]